MSSNIILDRTFPPPTARKPFDSIYPYAYRSSDFPSSSHNQCSHSILISSRRTDLAPPLFQPQSDIIFHLRHSILPLSTSFAPRHHVAPSKYSPSLKVVLMCVLTPNHLIIIQDNETARNTQDALHRIQNYGHCRHRRYGNDW